QPGSGRPVNSLGLNFDCESSGARLAVRLINGTNQSCGTFVTPFIPGKFRPTPIKNDGTRYTWTLTYDPEANAGTGRFTFSIQGQRATHEAFEGKTFSVDLPDGYRQVGATFDRFGMMNMQKSGNPVSIYFDDLAFEGRTQNFDQDPNWVGSKNRATYQDREV